MPATFHKAIANQANSQSYRDKERIFSQGDAADAMFYVEAGNVKLTVLSKHGKKAVIAIYFSARRFYGFERWASSITTAACECIEHCSLFLRRAGAEYGTLRIPGSGQLPAILYACSVLTRLAVNRLPSFEKCDWPISHFDHPREGIFAICLV